MKKRAIAIIIAAVVLVLTLTLIPVFISADMEWKSFSENLTLTGEDQVHSWSNPTGENVNFVIVTLSSSSGLNGTAGVGAFVGLVIPAPQNYLFSQDGTNGTNPVISVSGIGTPNITTSFTYMVMAGFLGQTATIEYRWGRSIRTSELVCNRVWINEDNKFQFIFWYTYANNNWVRIYDMDGNMVYEADMPYDNPDLIVDLPDGMYTVKTFHDQPDPIQTFVIGKP